MTAQSQQNKGHHRNCRPKPEAKTTSGVQQNKCAVTVIIAVAEKTCNVKCQTIAITETSLKQLGTNSSNTTNSANTQKANKQSTSKPVKCIMAE